VTLRDALFDVNGQLIYEDDDESSLFGNVLLANGVPWPKMYVEPRQYRFRVLNAAISRSFDLSLTPQTSTSRIQMLVVGTDGGLTERAIPTTSLRIGMAERYEVVIDFAAHAGKTLLLRNTNPKNNVSFARTNQVMLFEVATGTPTHPNRRRIVAGDVLHPKPPSEELEPTADMVRRSLRFRRTNGHWTIDGKTWVDVQRSGFTANVGQPAFNSTEVWKLRNESGGWFHPIHIHLVDFKVLARRSTDTGASLPLAPYERGAKDVVYVGENQELEVIAKFGPQRGRYMLHCHNLVHEDHDMMHQFWVKGASTDPDRDGYNPMDPYFRAKPLPTDGSRPPLILPPTPDGVPQVPPPYPG
jgi:spore coat protein A, manganese oxidase